MNLDHGLGPSVMPRPSYCGAAAAMWFCTVSLAGACVAGFVVTDHLIRRFWRKP